MSIILISALGKNNEIGKDNNLIWRIPEDMKFFKEQTLHHIIVMGKNTFKSLPNTLPNRVNIVITSSTINNEKIIIYKNIFDVIKDYSNEEIFIIGGANIYKAFLPYASKMYLTHIDKECKSADTYFPQYDINDWNTKILHNGLSYNDINYKRIEYTRKLERTK